MHTITLLTIYHRIDKPRQRQHAYFLQYNFVTFLKISSYFCHFWNLSHFLHSYPSPFRDPCPFSLPMTLAYLSLKQGKKNWVERDWESSFNSHKLILSFIIVFVFISTASMNGHVGVVHFIENKSDVEWIMREGKHHPYIALFRSDQFDL